MDFLQNLLNSIQEWIALHQDLLMDYRLWIAVAVVVLLIILIFVMIGRKKRRRSLNKHKKQQESNKKEMSSLMRKAEKSKEKKKYAKAENCYVKAAAVGESQALVELVLMYRGTDPKKAQKYLEQAKAKEAPGIYTLLSQINLKGWMDQPVHLPKAMAYAEKAQQMQEEQAAEQLRQVQKAVETRYAKFLVPLFTKYSSLQNEKELLLEQRQPEKLLLKLDECAGLLPKPNSFYMKNAPDTQHKVDVIRNDINNTYGQAYMQARDYEKAAACFKNSEYDSTPANAYVRALCYYEGVRTGKNMDFINGQEAYELSKYAASNGYYGALELQVQISQLYQKQLEERVRALDAKAAQIKSQK